MNDAILLSGGIDSIALAYWKRPSLAITLDYGQKPALSEIRSSEAVCRQLQMEHLIIKVDCSGIGSGDLAEVPSLNIAPSSEWWPYRNQLLVTIACMKVVGLGIKELMAGSVLSDGFHKDGTKEFYNLINKVMSYQEGAINISAPAINFSSIDLVLKSQVPPEILYYAHSCHKENTPCGNCRGCNKYTDVIQKLKDAGWEKSFSTQG